MNTAARLEQLNKELNTSILISQATARLIWDQEDLKGRIKEHGGVRLRGKAGLIKVLEVCPAGDLEEKCAV